MGMDVFKLVVDYVLNFLLELIVGPFFSFIGNLFFGGGADPLA